MKHEVTVEPKTSVEDTLAGIKPLNGKAELWVIAKGDEVRIVRKGLRVFKYAILGKDSNIDKQTEWKTVHEIDDLIRNEKCKPSEPPVKYQAK